MNAQIEKDITKKQQYLREEILNKNYDIDEFSEFMSQFKENGLDLVNWTLDELKNAVTLFKNKPNSKEEEQKEIEKGVENIRQSFLLNQDEYPDLDKSNNSKDNNNCININYDYNVINYKNIKNSNDNIYYSNENNNNLIEKNNNISQKDNHIIEKENNSNTIKDNHDINSSIINKELLNDRDNNANRNPNKENKSKAFSEFEIVDETSFNNEEIPLEKIPCIKQSQNSLTNNNNLYAELDS